jgi:hypothetical protein
MKTGPSAITLSIHRHISLDTESEGRDVHPSPGKIKSSTSPLAPKRPLPFAHGEKKGRAGPRTLPWGKT